VHIDCSDCSSWLFVGICLTRLGQPSEALQALERAHGINPRSIVLHEAIGDAHFRNADYPRAGSAYLYAHTMGGSAALLEAKLGATEVHLGHAAQGVQRIQRAIEREPSFPELHDVAAAATLLAGDVQLATAIAIRRTHLDNTCAFHFALASALTKRTGDLCQADSILQLGLAPFPTAPELQQAGLQQLFELVTKLDRGLYRQTDDRLQNF
jgi:Tfp pilus assembly protein PilF